MSGASDPPRATVAVVGTDTLLAAGLSAVACAWAGSGFCGVFADLDDAAAAVRSDTSSQVPVLLLDPAHTASAAWAPAVVPVTYCVDAHFVFIAAMPASTRLVDRVSSLIRVGGKEGAVVPETATARDLKDALSSVCAGDTHVSPKFAHTFGVELPDLTPREVNVVAMIGTGASTVDIARELMVAPQTVDSHVRSLFKKLHVSDRAAAVQRSYELGLMQP